jgi:hypothetical protein
MHMSRQQKVSNLNLRTKYVHEFSVVSLLEDLLLTVPTNRYYLLGNPFRNIKNTIRSTQHFWRQKIFRCAFNNQ